jgi:hypothetical protein
VAGTFDEFDGFPRSHLVRLNGDSKLLRILPSVVIAGEAIRFRVHTGQRELPRVQIQGTADLTQQAWQAVQGEWEPGNPATFVLPNGARGTAGFYRAVGR